MGRRSETDFPTEPVTPFILRSVSMLGIDSAAAARQRREEAWTQLSRAAGKAVDRIRSLHAFSGVQTLASTLLDRKSHGRVVLQWEYPLSAPAQYQANDPPFWCSNDPRQHGQGVVIRLDAEIEG